jgi:hypothetical protein
MTFVYASLRLETSSFILSSTALAGPTPARGPSILALPSPGHHRRALSATARDHSAGWCGASPALLHVGAQDVRGGSQTGNACNTDDPGDGQHRKIADFFPCCRFGPLKSS